MVADGRHTEHGTTQHRATSSSRRRPTRPPAREHSSPRLGVPRAPGTEDRDRQPLQRGHQHGAALDRLLHLHLPSKDALDDIHDPDTPAPRAVDETGRSTQQFVVDVVVRRGTEERCISAAGQDIYAVTAPLVAEGVERLLDGRSAIRGAAAPGETYDAREFLAALSPDHLTLST